MNAQYLYLYAKNVYLWSKLRYYGNATRENETIVI